MFELDYLLTIIIVAGIYAIFSLGLNLEWGYAGLLNFGHVGFMAIGAYTTVILSLKGVPLLLAVLAGIILSGALAAVLGIATLKLREDYLAIVTIGFSEVLRFILLNESWLTQGSFGIHGFPRPLENVVSFGDYNLVLAGMILLVLIILYILIEILVKSPFGRMLKSIREDEDVSKSLGKDVFNYKVQALALGSMIAALAGSFLSFYLQYINPENFMPIETFHAWIIIVLGGSGNNKGTILGALLLWGFFSSSRFIEGFIPISTTSWGAIRVMLIGLALVLLMMFKPQGILGRKEEMALGR
jgi:ABC-type branched-subunit amino acid transport system permease subunit